MPGRPSRSALEAELMSSSACACAVVVANGPPIGMVSAEAAARTNAVAIANPSFRISFMSVSRRWNFFSLRRPGRASARMTDPVYEIYETCRDGGKKFFQVTRQPTTDLPQRQVDSG